MILNMYMGTEERDYENFWFFLCSHNLKTFQITMLITSMLLSGLYANSLMPPAKKDTVDLL
jgi:hypothetical protein